MKQEKLATFVNELGFTMKDHGAIIVKRTPEGIPQEVIEFLTKTDRYSSLCLCENEMVLVRLSEVFGIKRDSYRVIAYDDIRKVQVETADGGMTRHIEDLPERRAHLAQRPARNHKRSPHQRPLGRMARRKPTLRG